MDAQAQQLIDFWFSKTVQPHWFNSTPELDQQILKDYGSLWEKGLQGKLNHWLETPEDSLALLILLDQLPLNYVPQSSQKLCHRTNGNRRC